ncbi:MAG: histidinol-phosphate transaminase [Clostridia bacterium]|nr:histidinol-phosphate transaminase [Clostridia bacterium]
MDQKLIREAIMAIRPYVPGKPVEEVKREFGLTDIIKLASNENPVGPSKRVIQAMKEACEKINYYPDAGGYDLKQALAAFCGVEPENIILGNGSDENIKMVAEAFLNPGEEVILGSPSFPTYDYAGKLMAGKMVPVPLKNFTYDLEAILAKITDNTKIVIICNPNNPTGTMVTKEELTGFLAQVPEHVIVILDEAYAEYVEREDYPDGIEYFKQGKKVIVLRTFSKIYGLAGIRVGYGIADKELIGYIERVKEPFNVNVVAQAAAIVALEDQEHVNYCREENAKGLAYIEEELAKMGLTWVESHTNFLLVNVQADSRKLFDELLKLGVIIRPGFIWGLNEYIRVTVGTPAENQKFIEALSQALEICR